MRKDLVVTKANALVEASYRLSISEQRCISMLTAQIHPDDGDFKPYLFKVSDLADLLDGGDRRDLYTRVRQLTKELVTKGMTILEDDGPLQITWLSSAKYFAEAGEVQLCFDPLLKPYMLKLKERFTTYRLANVIKLRSRYSVRLYELLKQYEKLGKRSFGLADLRKTLGLEGGEFKLWADFRRKVLNQAKRELLKKTDLGFSYEARKSGRAVAFVDFKIWSTESRGLSGKKLKTLQSEALKCWTKISGSCAAQWSNYETNPTHACHWCQKFEKSRLEAQGQKRLFPETDK